MQPIVAKIYINVKLIFLPATGHYCIFYMMTYKLFQMFYISLRSKKMIGEKLSKLRKENGISQEQLAEKLNISRQAISKWENNETLPDTENLIAIAKLFNVSIDDLVGNNPSNSEQNSNNEKDAPKKSSSKTTELIGLISLVLSISIFLYLGIVHGMWHPGWIVFLLLPLSGSLSAAIVNKTPSKFAYPILSVIIFMGLGYFNYWHPGWIIFVTIPVYYAICGIIERHDNEEKID